MKDRVQYLIGAVLIGAVFVWVWTDDNSPGPSIYQQESPRTAMANLMPGGLLEGLEGRHDTLLVWKMIHQLPYSMIEQLELAAHNPFDTLAIWEPGTAQTNAETDSVTMLSDPLWIGTARDLYLILTAAKLVQDPQLFHSEVASADSDQQAGP